MNLNELNRKENSKGLDSHPCPPRSSMILFSDCRVFPSNFFFSKRKDGPMSLKQYRPYFPEPCGYPDSSIMDINTSSSTLFSPYLFRLHLPQRYLQEPTEDCLLGGLVCLLLMYVLCSVFVPTMSPPATFSH